MDAQGQDITPKTNVVTYRMTKKKQEGEKIIEREHSRTDETILTDAEAARYTLENVFGDWHPDQVVKQTEKKAKRIKKVKKRTL